MQEERNRVSSLRELIESPFKDLEYVTNLIVTKGAEIGWSLVSALITLFLGFWLAGKLKKLIERKMIENDVDLSIRTFVIPIINIVFRLVVLVFVVARLGLNASGFIAALGGAGLAVGLALQGSLSNFAAGILIILFKPFKVGDYIVSQGNEGSVLSISLLNTTLDNIKGQVIVLPNANLFNNPITNFSIQKYRRLDIKIGISYEDDFEKAQTVLNNVLDKNKYVETSQPRTVEILEFGDSSVNLALRCYINNNDFWTAYWQLHKEVKYALDENNISIPYPHTEMIVKGDESASNFPLGK